jgi:hypothetical protein
MPIQSGGQVATSAPAMDTNGFELRMNANRNRPVLELCPISGQFGTGAVPSPDIFVPRLALAPGAFRGKLGKGGHGIQVAMKVVMDNNINKASVSLLAMAALVIAAVAAKVRATVEAQAPVGYEDESGFHFGNQVGE